MSPELAINFISAEPTFYAGPPADCWALGVVCYEIFAGLPPFVKGHKLDDREDKLLRISSPFREVELPADSFGHVSDAGRAFLRRLLTRSPTERATVQEALQLAWMQPITDSTLRSAMSEPRNVDAKRAVARKRLQSVIGRVALVTRLMGQARSREPMEDETPPARQSSKQSSASVSSFANSFKKRPQLSRQSSKLSVLASLSGSNGVRRELSGSFRKLNGSNGSAPSSPSKSGGGSFKPSPMPIPAVDVINIDPITYHASISSPHRASPTHKAAFAAPTEPLGDLEA